MSEKEERRLAAYRLTGSLAGAVPGFEMMRNPGGWGALAVSPIVMAGGSVAGDEIAQRLYAAQHRKEAQEEKKKKKKKKERLNKMQQAALLGGGAAMLGLGGLGYALHKGAKETNQIAKGVQDSINRSRGYSQRFSNMVDKARSTDRTVANETRKAFKGLPDLTDSSGFGD